MKGLAVLAALVVVHQVAAAPWWKSLLRLNQVDGGGPNFCKGYECPEYKLIQQYEGFELREYETSTWVTTNIPEMEESFWENHSFLSIMRAYFKLFTYLCGFNDQGVRIDRTLPVLLVHEQDAVQMSFMLPNQHTTNPPHPELAKVHLTKIPGQQLYVRTFGGNPYGFAWKDPWNQFKNETKELKRLLNEQALQFEDSVFYTAEYKVPWAVGGQHNEVWIRKT